MINKDTKKHTQSNIFDIQDSIIPPDNRAFVWDWTNRPPKPLTTVKLNKTRLLTRGNTLLIAARPGVGKSSICEAICAAHLNPACDSLGFSIELPAHRNKIIYFDTEQSTDDTWDCGYRIMKRAGIKDGTNTKNKFVHIGLKLLAVKERKSFIETILKQNFDIGMVLIDGSADCIVDTNSIHEAVDFHDWLNTFNPAISIITTVHTNPGDDKPRGHIGSEMMRKAKAVLLLRKTDEDVREITTNFAHGKNRSDNDQLSVYYKYSDDCEMFVSAEYKPVKAINKEKIEEYRSMIATIFEGKTICSASFIISKIMELTGKIEPTSRTLFYRHFNNKLVIPEGDGYKLI